MAGNLPELIDALDEGLVFVSAEGVVLLANAASSSIMRTTRGELLASEELRNRLKSAHDGTLALPARFDFEMGAGRMLAVKLMRSPVGDGYLFVLRDIGVARRQEAIVGNFANLLNMELCGRLKQLSDALGQQLTELIPDKVRRSETASALQTLARNGEHIQSRLIQLASFAQVFSRSPIIAVDRIPVGDFINALSQRLQPLLTEKRIQLKIATGWQELPVVYGSQAWLVEAIYGYAEYALQHCQRRSDFELVLNAYGHFVRLQLNNRGLGVPLIAEGDEEAFGDLALGQGDGLGLGLPLCRQIVALHKGHLRLLEEAGEIVAMAIELPAGAPAEQESGDLDSRQARRYAEDLAKLMHKQRRQSEPGDAP